jgi:hypothetical protein
MTRPHRVAVGFVALVALVGLTARPADASVGRLCRISASGSQSGMTAEVQFFVGREMSPRERPADFVPSAIYAQVRFADGQVTWLQFRANLTVAGTEFTNDDFRRLFTDSHAKEFLQVNGARGRVWNVAGRDASTFIDPRANADLR